MDLKKEFTYNLKVPFEVGDKGNMVFAETITIKAPTSRINCYTSVLDSEFSRAILKLAETSKTEKKSKNSDSQELFDSDDDKSINELMIIGAAYGDINKAYDAFKKILLEKTPVAPIATINGDIKITRSLVDDIADIDFKQLVGRYLLNFLLVSLAS